MSSQSQKSQALLSLWGHLVLTSIAKQTHTHTHRFLWFSRTLMAKQVGWWFKGTHLSQCPTEMIKLSNILFYSAEHKYHFGFSLHTIEWII